MVAERLVVEKKKRRGSCACGALCDGGQDAQDAPPSAPSKASSGLPSAFDSTWKHWENTVTQESNAHDDDDDYYYYYYYYDSDSDSSMEASRDTDEHRSPGRANTKKTPYLTASVTETMRQGRTAHLSPANADK